MPTAVEHNPHLQNQINLPIQGLKIFRRPFRTQPKSRYVLVKPFAPPLLIRLKRLQGIEQPRRAFQISVENVNHRDMLFQRGKEEAIFDFRIRISLYIPNQGASNTQFTLIHCAYYTQ